MATVQIELNDKGEPVGSLPPEVDALFKRKHDEGYGKGRQTAAEEAKSQIEANVKAEIEKLKGQGLDPVARERLRQLEDKEKQRAIEEAERQKQYDEALKLREQSEAEKLAEKDKEIARRDKALTTKLRKEIRAAAAEVGARPESLDELEQLLADGIALDEHFEPYVKGSDGKPAQVKNDKGETVNQSVGAYVNAYLDSHPHHRKAPAGKGGGAPGGRTFSGSGAPATDKDQAFTAVSEAPTVKNIGRALSHAGKGA